MTDWSYIVSGLSLLLLSFLIWKELRRRNRARLAGRIAATVLAITALAGIALPLSYRTTQKMDTSHQAILLTEGYDSDSLSAFLRAEKNNIPVYILDAGIRNAGKHDAVWVAELAALPAEDNGVLHVFGNGLSAAELAAWQDDRVIRFHPSAMPSGIASVSWPSKLQQGEKLNVQGRFHNASSKPLKLSLRAFDHTLDSVIIPAGGDHPFQLGTVPKLVGRALYFVSVNDGKNVTQKYPVPVVVQQGEPLSVLVLASSPDFENRFVKNWLAQKGYRVIVRTAISKNKWAKEYLNTAALNVDRITASLLDQFDIILTDASELASMGKGELSILEASIAQKGKGLIVRADSAATRSSFYANRFPLVTGSTVQQQQVNLTLSDSSTKLQPLIVETPVFMRVQNGTLPLLADRQNRVFVNSIAYGSGKVLFTTLANTYSWALSGNQSDFDHVWSELLNKAAAKKTEAETWRTVPALPRVNRPVTMILQTDNGAIPRAVVEGTTVYLNSHYQLPYEWTGRFWPGKQGWQSGIQLNGQTYYWYAYGNDDWKEVEAYGRRLVTQQYQQYHTAVIQESSSAGLPQQVEINKAWFFLIFLVCCGFLWLENKYYSRY